MSAADDQYSSVEVDDGEQLTSAQRDTLALAGEVIGLFEDQLRTAESTARAAERLISRASDLGVSTAVLASQLGLRYDVAQRIAAGEGSLPNRGEIRAESQATSLA